MKSIEEAGGGGGYAFHGGPPALSDDTMISDTVAIAVPTGSHTIRMWPATNTTGGGYLIIGSPVAEWTAGGDVVVAGGPSSVPTRTASGSSTPSEPDRESGPPAAGHPDPASLLPGSGHVAYAPAGGE